MKPNYQRSVGPRPSGLRAFGLVLSRLMLHTPAPLDARDIDSMESRQNRYALFNELPDDLTSSLTVEQNWVVDRVVIEYEGIGSLVVRGFIDSDLIATLYENSTERSWKRVEPKIQKERMRRNNAPYAPNFEEFAKKCAEYNAQRHPGGLELFKRADKLSRDKRREVLSNHACAGLAKRTCSSKTLYYLCASPGVCGRFPDLARGWPDSAPWHRDVAGSIS